MNSFKLLVYYLHTIIMFSSFYMDLNWQGEIISYVIKIGQQNKPDILYGKKYKFFKT